jgi:F0F1-type ATP synthase assembly protein I
MLYSPMVRGVKGACMNNDDDDTRHDRNASDESLWAAFAVPGQIVAYIVGGAALGLLAGHFIDGALNSAPIATFIGLLLGLAIGTYGVYRLVTSLR